MLKALLGILIILGFIFTYFLTYYLAYDAGYQEALDEYDTEIEFFENRTSIIEGVINGNRENCDNYIY